MKKPILLFLFLVSAAFADAQNFLIGGTALPSTLTACQTGNFETTIDLNGNNLTALDLSLEFQVSNLGLPVNSWTCSSCTPTATYPIALTNLSVLNADPVTPMLVSPGVYKIALSNITGTSVTLSYDYVIDCSIVSVDPNSMLTLSDSWTCLQGTLNGATSYDRNYNIDYPRFTVPGSQGAIGGKITGAGGGGFLLLFVPPGQQAAVEAALPQLVHVPFRFETSGSQILFYDREQDFASAEAGREGRPIRDFRELAGAETGVDAQHDWAIPYPITAPSSGATRT